MRGGTGRTRTVFMFLAIGLLAAAGPALAVEWEVGDVAVGVSGGRYQIYDRLGNFKQTITTQSGFTTGCAFDSDGDLYTTYFSSGNVVVFDGDEPHGILQTIISGANGATTPESVVFAKDGSFYVGHVGGSQDILKYNAAGVFQQTFNAAVGPVGTDWIDLAANQTTMFHTSEGRQIRRYDLSTSSQLTDWAVLPGSGRAFAFRILPPGDGTGGVLVADEVDIKRLNSAGAVVQTYDVAGENSWFALNLDASGTSFWSGNYATGNFYRINITTGAIEVGPINTGTGGNTLFGICVYGEITAAINNPPIFTSPACGTRIQVDPGDAVSFAVTASDSDIPSQTVTLTSGALPAGATMTPPLPTSGNPVSSTFNWTPSAAFENTVQTIVFTATDDDPTTPKTASCRIEIEVGEDVLIVLRSFTATPRNDEVLLEWATELELDNAGFYLLRRNVATGYLDRVIDTLIPAQGDIFQGAEYSYVDTTAANGVQYDYYLVDVDLYGIETSRPSGYVVPNPANPPIKLRIPAYANRISIDAVPSFAWEPFTPGSQMLQISSDPTFDSTDTLTLEVRGSIGRSGPSQLAPRSIVKSSGPNTDQGTRTFESRRASSGQMGQMTLSQRDIAMLERLAISAVGLPLYWRVVEPVHGSTPKVSDTFSLWVDVGPLQGGSPDAGNQQFRVK